MFKLTITKGAAKGKEFEVKDLTIIGRMRTNTVAIDDSMASREHTRIAKESDGYYVEDLKSRNGTLLNGQKIEKSRLAPGDLVTIGRTELKFEEGSVSSPPPEQLVQPSRQVKEEQKPEGNNPKAEIKLAAPQNNQKEPAKRTNIFYYLLILIFFAILFLLSYNFSKLWIAKIMEQKKPATENTKQP
ncbi:MAG: FHA domain-containing protein [Planctomycetota bacterium]